MTAALVVAGLVALVGWGFVVAYAVAVRRWRRRAGQYQALAADYREMYQDAYERADGHWRDANAQRLTLATVGAVLAKVWHHVTPASPEEGAAVAVLRNAFPELPVPEASRSAVPDCNDMGALREAAAARGDYLGLGVLDALEGLPTVAVIGPQKPAIDSIFASYAADMRAQEQFRQRMEAALSRIAPTPDVPPLKEES